MMRFRTLMTLLVVWSVLAVACNSSPPSFKDKWLKLVPGQSGTSDVLNLLGSPNLKAKGFLGEVWCYDPPQPGQGCMEFRDSRVLTTWVPIGFGTSSDLDPEIRPPYTLTNLLRDYGSPSLIYEHVTSAEPFTVPVTSNWTFSYPTKGFDVNLWRPGNGQPGSPPPANSSVVGRVFYAPLSLDEYRMTFSPTHGKNDREITDIGQFLRSVLSP